MDRVEKHVRLPEGARPFGEYARYYAQDDEGRVRVVYTTYVEPKLEYYDVSNGQRQWVEDYKNLPLIHDGGCGVVRFVFIPDTGEIEQPVCNGEV